MAVHLQVRWHDNNDVDHDDEDADDIEYGHDIDCDDVMIYI